MASAKVNPAAPKPEPLGTRCGRLLNKLEKLNAAEAEELAAAPQDIRKKYALKRGKAKSEADEDVCERLNIDQDSDAECKLFLAGA